MTNARGSHWLVRLVRHRLYDERDARAKLSAAALQRIQAQVAASERAHDGEIRICIEAGLPFSYIRSGATARERAIAMFGKLGVWDTERNNGVLIYLLLAEHAIEIVADRGLAARVPQTVFAELAAAMGEAFRRGDFEAGLLRAVDEVGKLLREHFAVEPGRANPNELPDAPVFN
jgi:uncharacterized membrane protein